MKREKRYLSEDFTKEFIEGFKKDYIYMIGAECGAGKTTAIMENLVTYARKNNKSVLFLCNRSSLHLQLIKKYMRKAKKQNACYTLNNLSLGMYQSITGLIKEHKNYKIFEKDYDFVVVDEAHLIYDAADYDSASCIFLEFLNKQSNFILTLSGTPDSFLKLSGYLKRDIKVIREVDRTNNNIRKVTLVTNRKQFIEMKKEYLTKGYKLLELVSSVSYKVPNFHFDLKDFKTACALSKYNQSYWDVISEEDEDIYEDIINTEKMNCDALIATSFFNVGVSIKADRNFVITFDCTELPNTIEQFASRIRFESNSNLHADIIFYVKKPRRNIIESLYSRLFEIDSNYKNYNDPKDALKDYLSFCGQSGYELALIQKRKINPIRRSLLKEKIDYYEEILYSKKPTKMFKAMFERLYPCADVIDEKMETIEDKLEELLINTNEIVLQSKSEKLWFREWMNQFKIHDGHGNELPSMNRINKFFSDNNLNYLVTNPRMTIYGKTLRVWVVSKVPSF